MRVFKVLLEGTPDNVDVYRICADMEEVEGVTLVHDVHAWTITSGYNAFTAHVFVSPTHARAGSRRSAESSSNCRRLCTPMASTT